MVFYRHKPEYRLFLDDTDLENHYALLGCIMSWDEQQKALNEFEVLKGNHFSDLHNNPHPVIFQRRAIVRCEAPFNFATTDKQENFCNELAGALSNLSFRSILVALPREQSKRDPRTYFFRSALPLVLHRYCEYLHRHSATGDVFAEHMGAKENASLKYEYETIRESGAEGQPWGYYRTVLTSKYVRIEEKNKNIPGLQIADLLAAPMLRKYVSITKSSFDAQLQKVGEAKQYALQVKIQK